MSATIVDALIVTLGLDAKEFERGHKQTQTALDKTRKDADKTAKDLEQAGKRAAQFFTKVRNEALAFFAVLAVGSGLKSFVQETISTASGLDRMSANLNMSTRDLSEWQLAAKHVGGTAEGMSATLQQAADDVAKYKLGLGSETLNEFYRQHGNVNALKDANSLLLEKADIIKRYYDADPNMARVIAGRLGVTDEGSFNLLKQGRAATQEQLQAQSKLAEQMARAAKPAEELRKKFDSLKNSFQEISINVLNSLMPVFDRLLVYFTQLGDWVATHDKEITQWVNEFVNDLIKFAHKADDAAQAVGGWQTILVALLALKMLSFTADLIGMAGALGRVGSALGLVGTVGPGALKILGGAGLLLHSEELNKGEDEELARRRANAGPASAGGNTASRQQFLLSRLKADGYTDAQAAGIIGSLMQESGLNPSAVNPKSGARGIAQWLSKDRVGGFEKRYGHGLSQSTFEEQADYMLWELRNTEKRSGDLLRRAPNADMAAQIHAWEYERPGHLEAHIADRMRYAQSVLATYGGGSALAAAQLPNATRTAPTPSAPGSSVSSETHIGVINVQTQATDANGIAKDLHGAVSRYSMASQANTGVN